MSKPRLLDLFCGAGGAAVGYYRAGFEVVGVDIVPQKNYPFPFILGDALDVLARMISGEKIAARDGNEYGLDDFAAIHASPPCQFASQITPDKSRHENLIPATRKLLIDSGRHYVIENVMGARSHLRAPFMVCGMPLGLKVYRHRWFESDVMVFGTPHYPHRDNTPRAGHGLSDKGFISVTGGGNRTYTAQIKDSARRRGVLPGVSEKGFVSITGHISGVDYCRWAMGIDWMTGKELCQAIPPAFTEYVGRQLMDILAVKVA